MRRKIILSAKRIGFKRMLGVVLVFHLAVSATILISVAVKNYTAAFFLLVVALVPGLVLGSGVLAFALNEKWIRESRQLTSSDHIPTRQSVLEKANDLARTSTMYAPGAVTSIEQAKKSKKQQAGRVAAIQIADPESAIKMSFLLDRGGDAQFVRKVAFVGALERAEHFGPLLDVVHLYPGADPISLDPEIGLLVIDEISVNDNAWRGVLDSSGASKFLELQERVAEIKRRNGLVIGIVSQEISHLTLQLRKSYDVRIDRASGEIMPSAAKDLKVLRMVASGLTGGGHV